MITIGIRAAPKVVTFAVYDSTSRTVINVEEIKIPAAFSLPDRLKYVRSNLLDVLREYKVEQAGIRETEPAAQSSSIERVQIESVIQEAFASSELKGKRVIGAEALARIPRPSHGPATDSPGVPLATR